VTPEGISAQNSFTCKEVVKMPVPDTQRLKLELKSWSEYTDRQFPGKDTPAIAVGRELLEALHRFERLTGPRSKSFGAVIPVTGPNKIPNP
jgi:hypothetical protein